MEYDALSRMKRVAFLLLVLFSACRLDAAGIKGLISEYVATVENRIALQPLLNGARDIDARFRSLCASEKALETPLRKIFHGEDDIAEVAMGYLAEADFGDAILYFHGLIPTDSSSPAARRVLEKMKGFESRRRDGEKTGPDPIDLTIPGIDASISGRAGRIARSVGKPVGEDILPDLTKFEKIRDMRPTYYVTTREDGFPTSGPLFGHTYDGTERKTILTPSGVVIAETSGRYFADLCMEGSGVIKDGRTVSFVSDQRFNVAPEGCLGITCTGYWVVPFHTLAVNRNQLPYRGVYFIPGTRGLKLPNGETHDGYWFAHDTGSAFNSTTDRFDMYVDRVEYWKWMEANFVNSFSPIKVYKVDADTRTRVYAKYQSVLGKNLSMPASALEDRVGRGCNNVEISKTVALED